MSSKMILGILVAVIAIATGAYYWHSSSQPDSTATTADSASSADATPGNTGTSATASSDKSDAALVKDSAAIDTQLSGLSADNASMNQSDQAGAQSY